MPKRKVLLLSNTRNPDQDHLEHARQAICDTLGRGIKEILFIPYAEVSRSFAAFTKLIREKLMTMGYTVKSIGDAVNPLLALADAEAIFIGGGNTFHWLYRLRAHGLMEAIRRRVAEGVPYVGSSAGANIACPTIKTTNDMPIIDPGGFEGLNLVPFQINPHFTDVHPSGHQGESRCERIREFLELHPDTYVVGLREGSMLQVDESSVALLGESGARVFLRGQQAEDFFPGDSLQFLLTTTTPRIPFSGAQKTHPDRVPVT